MSGLLAGKVWLSALEAHLKPLAATLADIANDDGTSIYPTIAYVAWRLGAVERTVQRGVSDLLSIGVLVKEADAYHHRPAEYRLVEHALPKRDGWTLRQPKNRGVKLSPQKPETGVTSATVRGDIDDSEGRHLEQSGVTSEALSLPLSLNDPLLDPSRDPSERESSLPLATPAGLVEVWNTERQPGPKVTSLPPVRQQRYRRALLAEPLLDDWRTAIRWLNRQAYANAPGTGEHGSWRATLDWLTKPGKLREVVEGAHTDAVAPPRRARDGCAPQPETEAEKQERVRRRDDSERVQEALKIEAADLVLNLSPAGRKPLEDDALEDLEYLRQRATPSQFDEWILRALPLKLIARAKGRPLADVVAELEGKKGVAA